jgi:membrane protease YdiL (CAAX protease family)
MLTMASSSSTREPVEFLPAPGWSKLALVLSLTALPIAATTVLAPVAVSLGLARVLPSPFWSFALYAFTCWAGLAVVMLIGGTSMLRTSGFRFAWSWSRVASALVGFLLGVTIYVVVLAVLQQFDLPTIRGMNFRYDSVAPILVMALATVVSAPFCEEVFFRVLWVGALSRKIGLWPAAVCSVLFFSAIHYPYFGTGGVIFIAVWSLVPMALFVRYGDLTAPLLMHVLNNAFAYLIVPLFSA